MKKQIYITALMTLLFCIDTVSASDIKIFRDDALGFEVSYTNNWAQSKRPDNPAFFIQRKSSEKPGTIGIKIANFTGDKNKFMEQLKTNPEILTKKVKQRFPDAILIKSGNTFLGGFPAYYVKTSFSIKNLDFEMKIISFQIISIKDRKIYLVNFETPEIIFNNTFKEFQSIMATFNYR